MLPSFLYLTGGPELPPGSARLPWSDGGDRIVGEFARIQGARVPGRLVASAKSWLCHAGVDREADDPPLGRPRARSRRSRRSTPRRPTCATSATPGTTRSPPATPRRTSKSQEVVLTVPASFDEAARELTVEAAEARRAEVDLTLLEEPQAAFYCWIVTHQDRWQRQVRAGELILVCDIGGGTTDFSLITVVETPTGPGFRRVAVGDHLMLGGDNIDLALAHHVERKLGGSRLDSEQWSALRFACRTAKEKLLLDQSPPIERWPVTIAGRGSRLIGGSIQSELTRDEVREIAHRRLLPDGRPRRRAGSRGASSGFQEFGLPFVADPAIPSIWRPSSAATGPRRSGTGGTRPTTAPRGPTRSCSTAAP